MGVIPDGEIEDFKAGDLVTVRRGKHTGTPFVVIGTEGASRAYITDGKNYPVLRPKKKNTAHLRKTLINLDDVAGRVAGGKPLDNGWLIQRITAISNNSGTSCRQGG